MKTNQTKRHQGISYNCLCRNVEIGAFVDPRYRDVTWRIAHQIIPTQSLLYKYNTSRNIKCYLCKRQPETISHLFYECRTLSGLWSFVETTLSSNRMPGYHYP